MPIQLSHTLPPGPGKSGWLLRVLLLPVLLLAGSVCQAEVLYKWLESDGSVTFSPKPPVDSSIAYEKVVSGQGQVQGKGKTTSPVNTAAKSASNASLPAGLTREPINVPANASASAIQRPATRPSMTRSTQKTAQCEELKKRVTSLERLLQTDISNERMDNAVVQMARYQTSFNQACNRLSLR